MMDRECRRNLASAGLGLAIALVAIAAPRRYFSSYYTERPLSESRSLRSQRFMAGAHDSDENEVSTDDVDKYVAVYKAMQRNKNLTVDQAADAQGLTTRQFRELEDRVQRDEAALQQARDELQAAVQNSPTAGGRSVTLPP